MLSWLHLDFSESDGQYSWHWSSFPVLGGSEVASVNRDDCSVLMAGDIPRTQLEQPLAEQLLVHYEYTWLRTSLLATFLFSLLFARRLGLQKAWLFLATV